MTSLDDDPFALDEDGHLPLASLEGLDDLDGPTRPYGLLDDDDGYLLGDDAA